MDKRYEIERKVISYMEGLHMLEAGDCVVLGVSGGADSVCMLLLLLAYQRVCPISLQVVHINHGIRPEAAQDAGYVEELCREWGIPFWLEEVDVRTYAGEERCSQEDAGRRLRYEAFRRRAEALGGAKIAVAHNASDRAETLLLHLFRGSGLRGLCGIEPVRGNIIRPILCLQREEIECYLREREIAWCTDSTNLEDVYVRNRVRHHILPYVEKEIAGNCVIRMCRTAELLSETEQFLRECTSAARESCVTEQGIDVAAFGRIAPVLQKRILLEILEEMSPNGKDIGLVHVEEVLSLFQRSGNRVICLPFGIRFRRRYEIVIPEYEGLSAGHEEQSSKIQEEIAEKFTFRVFSYDAKAEIPQNQYTKWFDCDKINMFAVGENPVLRYRKPGDYLTLSDGKGGMIHKSLKDYMVTEKIPAECRARIPVLAEGNHILWLVGYRISEHYKVDTNTKKILEVTMLQ